MFIKALLAGLLLLIIISEIYAQPVNLVNSQDHNFRLIKLHYENSGGEKGVTTFEYNIQGELYRAVWELLDGTRFSINYYSYDNNRLIRKYREFSDSITSEEIFSYNHHGQLINEQFNRSDGMFGTAKHLIDGHGHTIKSICRKDKGWLDADISYLYNDQGKRVKGFIFQGNTQVGYINYEYDKEDNPVLETWDFNGEWNQQFRYEYESIQCQIYSSSNVFIRHNCDFRLIGEDYMFDQETGGPSFYEYNSLGRLIKKEFNRSDGFKTITTYDYNDTGRLQKSNRMYSDGKTGEFSYQYNENGQLVQRLFERSDGIKGSERYKYDKNGKLVMGCYDNFDSWLNGSLTFECDRYGNLSHGFFIGQDGFDADIDFQCDSYGNVIRIHWDFSFDKSQTYIFNYKKLND
ncbi:hypothetical protein ACFLU5_04310 [Bacteroidota bacterium]